MNNNSNNNNGNIFTTLASSLSFLQATSSEQVLDDYTAMIMGIPRSISSSSSSSSFSSNAVMEEFHQVTSPPYLSMHYSPSQPALLPFHPVYSPLLSSSSVSLPPPSPAVCSIALPSPSVSSTSEKRRYCCDQCPKSYLFKRCLSRHVATFHKGPKFTCDICQTVVSRKDALNRHRRKSQKCKSILQLEWQKLHGKALPPGAIANRSSAATSTSLSGMGNARRHGRVVDRYTPYPSPPPL